LAWPSNTFALHDLVPKDPHTVYDVAHAVPWGRKVSLYIWTKSIAAGAFLLSTLGVALGLVPDNPLLTWVAPILALLFLGLTTYLLIADLKRPERFYTILLRPQWRSWLTIGAYILLVYGALVGLSVLAAIFGATGLRHFLLWPGGIAAVWPLSGLSWPRIPLRRSYCTMCCCGVCWRISLSSWWASCGCRTARRTLPGRRNFC
jgi:hypothetical protein